MKTFLPLIPIVIVLLGLLVSLVVLDHLGRVLTPSTPPSPPTGTPVAAATADLALHLGIATEAITVRTVEEVTWGDSSLGCPRPGRAYTQALVPGYRIVLSYGDQTYEYHTDREGRQLVRCTDGESGG